MSNEHELEFANFILRFGSKRALMDLVEEVVIPAFNSGLERVHGQTKHFFHSVEVLNFGNEDNPVLCIAGRYIKDTVIKREQIFDQETNELRKDVDILKTSPSSVFILVLNNHRLIYLKETSYAPSMLLFQNTALKFIAIKYRELVVRVSSHNQHDGVTIKQLREEYDHPSLRIVPLSSDESIGEFINQYSLLKKVEIKLLTPNNEIDNNDFFLQARKIKEEVLADTTIITHNGSKYGLSKDAVKRELESVLDQGNSIVKLKGEDLQGNKLEGDNEKFKIKTQLSEIPHSIPEIAAQAYATFQEFVDQRIIRVGQSHENHSEKIKKIFRKINRGS